MRAPARNVFMKREKWLLSIIAYSIFILFTTSCEHETPLEDFQNDWNQNSGNNTSNENYLAPESPIGKIISWSEKNADGTSGNSNVRIKFINSTDLQTNFSDWCTYTYKKLSANKAHINFMAPQTVAGVVRTFQYDFDITYTSSTEFDVAGSLTVNYLSGPNVGQTIYNKFTGEGKYVDSLNGSSSDTGTQSPGTPENIAIYVGTWTEDVDKSQSGWSLKQTSYTFKSDGTYTHNGTMGLIKSTGQFKCTANTISLYVNSKLDNTLNLRNGKLTDTANNKTYSKN